MGVILYVLFSFWFCSVLGSDTYKAGVVDASFGNSRKYDDLIREAAKNNVDLLVLPPPKNIPSEGALDLCINEFDNYDEIVKSVSKAAKEGQLYVVAHLYETVYCQNNPELIRSNLVFNRNGDVVSAKPVNSASKCNTTMLKMGQFTTDFGVSFGVLMEEDILLSDVKEFNGINNFIVAGPFVSKTSFLFAKQFPLSWAYVNKVNLITSNGALAGNMNSNKITENMIVAEFEKLSRNDMSITTTPESFSIGDMSQYRIKPLDLVASNKGYSETVCQGRFCCQFYIKSHFTGPEKDITYGLVAFDGVQSLGSSNIGVQTCSITACAGLYKRSCFIGSENNNTNIEFEKLSINGTFSNDDSAYFPIISTSTQEVFNNENLKFTIDSKNFKYVSTELYNTQNILNFGILGRIYSRDYDSFDFGAINSTDVKDSTDYISSENVQEFFDYLWIKLRIVIFIVSIYVLEMM